MGRAFEYRKARKMKRWGHMARTFTKLGKEIEIAVKAAGPDPSGNTRLRILMQNAKAENMPKENVERAIKRATEKDAADYKEVIYEGYGSHGIAFLVETATDNTNRTVANVRMYFNKCGGTLGNSGSVAFMFDHKCVFKFRPAEGVDMEELELEMIDLGVDEFYPEEDGVTVYAPYESFGAIQKWLDDKGYEIVSGESVYLPTDTKELDAEGRESIEKLVEKLEEDDDVTNVYHNMKEVEEEKFPASGRYAPPRTASPSGADFVFLLFVLIFIFLKGAPVIIVAYDSCRFTYSFAIQQRRRVPSRRHRRQMRRRGR